MKVRRRALASVLGLVAAVFLAGCDDGSATNGTTGPPRTPVPQASAADPAIREAISAAPAFDAGQTVHITSGGLRPLVLASFCCKPVVFKNETAVAVSVTFNISRVTSGPIPPGGSWQWTPPNPESVIYHLGSDVNQSGNIEVQSPAW